MVEITTLESIVRAKIETLEIPKDEKMSTIAGTSSSPSSRRMSLDSANEPLLSDTEETLVEEDEKTSCEDKEEKKKSFSSAEHKIAFSHFLVRTTQITRLWANC